MKKEEEEKKVGWQSKYTEGKLAIGIDYYKFNYTQILKFYLLFQDFLIRSWHYLGFVFQPHNH